MKKFFYRVDYEILHKGVPVENGAFAWNTNAIVPDNEIKNHLKKIKFGNDLKKGVNREILIRYLKKITAEEFDLINYQIPSGKK